MAEVETDTGLAGVPGGSYNLLLRCGVLSLIRLHRNDLPGARDAVGAAPDELPATAGYRAHWYAWAHPLLLEADGEPARPLATLVECWDRCTRSGLGLEYAVIGPDLVRLALATGDAGWPVTPS